MAKKHNDSPIPDQLLAECQDALAKCEVVRQLAEKAQACGYDCRAHLAIEQGLRERLTAVLDNFGPGRIRE